jgi:hypothetical protein
MAASQNCVVCGVGSSRSDWINKLSGYVACDKHSKDEVAKAVALRSKAVDTPKKSVEPSNVKANAPAK